MIYKSFALLIKLNNWDGGDKWFFQSIFLINLDWQFFEAHY